MDLAGPHGRYAQGGTRCMCTKTPVRERMRKDTIGVQERVPVARKWYGRIQNRGKRSSLMGGYLVVMGLYIVPHHWGHNLVITCSISHRVNVSNNRQVTVLRCAQWRWMVLDNRRWTTQGEFEQYGRTGGYES